jgi:hypothetical protein
MPRRNIVALICACLEESQSIDLSVPKAVKKVCSVEKPFLFGGDVLSSTASEPNAVRERPNFVGSVAVSAEALLVHICQILDAAIGRDEPSIHVLE